MLSPHPPTPANRHLQNLIMRCPKPLIRRSNATSLRMTLEMSNACTYLADGVRDRDRERSLAGLGS